MRQRKPVDKPPSGSNASSAATGADGRRRPTSASSNSEPTKIKEKIISPELRQLLSRKVEVLDKTDVVEHGGGVGT